MCMILHHSVSFSQWYDFLYFSLHLLYHGRLQNFLITTKLAMKTVRHMYEIPLLDCFSWVDLVTFFTLFNTLNSFECLDYALQKTCMPCYVRRSPVQRWVCCYINALRHYSWRAAFQLWLLHASYCTSRSSKLGLLFWRSTLLSLHCWEFTIRNYGAIYSPSLKSCLCNASFTSISAVWTDILCSTGIVLVTTGIVAYSSNTTGYSFGWCLIHKYMHAYVYFVS